MNPKLKFIIVVGLTCGLGISIGFFLFSSPQTPTVNGSEDQVTIYKGEEHWSKLITCYTYGGKEYYAGTLVERAYLIVWMSSTSGCERIYISTGDTVMLGDELYNVDSIDNSRVIFTRVS